MIRGDVYEGKLIYRRLVCIIGSLLIVSRVDSFDAKSLRLQDHMDRKGMKRKCEIGEGKFGRGLIATNDLAPNDVVLNIPLEEAIVFDATDLSLKDDVWAGELASRLSNRISVQTSMIQKNVCPYVDSLPVPPATPARGEWSQEALQALDSLDMLNEIKLAMNWRISMCKQYCSPMAGDVEKQLFLDSLDLTSSRTIRCGMKFMLVPYLDLANHASREEGGGYYQLQKGESGDEIVLKAGDRGFCKGDEIFLDYGERTSEEWLIHYGFLPSRNLSGDSLILPDCKVKITWQDVNRPNEKIEAECLNLLRAAQTTLLQDHAMLRDVDNNELKMSPDMEMALRYRTAKKSLLAAVAGVKSSSIFSSVFL